MVLVFLQRFLQALHLLGLFALPPLLLPPFASLLISQPFAFQLPPSSLFLLFLSDSLREEKGKMRLVLKQDTCKPKWHMFVLIYLFILQEV